MSAVEKFRELKRLKEEEEKKKAQKKSEKQKKSENEDLDDTEGKDPEDSPRRVIRIKKSELEDLQTQISKIENIIVDNQIVGKEYHFRTNEQVENLKSKNELIEKMILDLRTQTSQIEQLLRQKMTNKEIEEKIIALSSAIPEGYIPDSDFEAWKEEVIKKYLMNFFSTDHKPYKSWLIRRERDVMLRDIYYRNANLFENKIWNPLIDAGFLTESKGNRYIITPQAIDYYADKINGEWSALFFDGTKTYRAEDFKEALVDAKGNYHNISAILKEEKQKKSKKKK